MDKRLTTVACVIVLGMVFVPRTTPAWSASTCPTVPTAPNTHTSSTADCNEERIEDEEERIEEELLEVSEDEEEERAIAVERASREASDVAEEAAEEAQERAELEKHASHLAQAKTALKLRVSVSARAGHSNKRPGETRISIATSIPAQVKIALRAHDGLAKLLTRQSAIGHKLILRVPWICHTQAQRYSFTVTARSENHGLTTAGSAIARHGKFTIDTQAICK